MQREIGQTVSFAQLLNGNERKIEIPIIQRDYAQGRESAKEIRTNFLKTLKHHLDDEKPLNLDFVFGSVEGETFIPLDGQQRLTTLFLLHWYLGWKAGEVDELKALLVANGKVKFTYETRISSREFCDQLVLSNIEPKEGWSISSLIQDQAWYYLHWKHDPTIVGMLNTLETIESLFGDPGSYYSKLTQQDSPLITFEFIKLENFGLTDDLYIKMNARGKPLTNFENLKAKIELLFKEHDKQAGSKETDWMTFRIDGVWTDLFWNFLEKKEDLPDELFVNFLRACLVNTCAITQGARKALNDLINNKKLDYYLIESTRMDSFEVFQDAFGRLNKLTANGGELVDPIQTLALLDCKNLFKSVVSNSLNNAERVQFFGLTELMLKKDPAKIPEWFRVIRNLTENSRLGQAELVNALQFVRQLVDRKGDILEILTEEDLPSTTGLSAVQITEERLKARLMRIMGSNLASKIKAIENHSYLKGGIGFLLDFTGFSNLSEDQWNDEAVKALIPKFDEYVEKFNACFKSDGIREFPDFIFERALLSYEDYLLNQRSNWSFLINGTDRDISWRAWLRKKEKVAPLKEVFDSTDFQSDQAEESLQTIISKHKVLDSDWRYFFVKYPAIIAQTGTQRFIRWDRDGRYILLLKTSRTSGTHREYYSFALKCQLESMGYSVGYESSTSANNEVAYISKINKEAISIWFEGWIQPYEFHLEWEKLPEKKRVFQDYHAVLAFLKEKFE